MKKKKLKVLYEPTKMDIKCAQMIRRAAGIQLKRDVPRWLEDTEMSDMITTDFMSLLKIADRLITFGPDSKTFDAVRALDTSCRDTIPNAAYDYIMNAV